jgi:cytochrome d ubiquinol oxidase subunit II
MLGIVAGAILLGRLGDPQEGFYAVFVGPWLNLFSFSIGIFTCAIFSFLAAVYLIGENPNESVRKLFVARAQAANIAVVGLGGFVFLAASLDGLDLFSRFLKDPMTLACMTLATALLVPLWLRLAQRSTLLIRVLAASQMSLILLGWFKLQFPTLIGTVTLYNAAAPLPTMQFLLAALIVGCVFIFPALFYLFRIFKVGT